MAYYEIGIYHTKRGTNVGTLWRSAVQLGAAGVFTIGRRYKHQSSDTHKVVRHIPLRHYTTFEDFRKNRPIGAVLVGVEMGGTPLSKFKHPKTAVYLLGAEDHGIPQSILNQCDFVVSLDAVSHPSYNVAVAGSIVMYHREFLSKGG